MVITMESKKEAMEIFVPEAFNLNYTDWEDINYWFDICYQGTAESLEVWATESGELEQCYCDMEEVRQSFWVADASAGGVHIFLACNCVRDDETEELPCDACNSHGWLLVALENGESAIERCDTCCRMNCDSEAIEYVSALALGGSRSSRIAT
jgi:hypothetical protein